MSLAFSVRGALCYWLIVTSLGEVAVAETHSPPPLGVLSQAGTLPAGFSEHFFDVPLAVRIDLDGRLLGEAMVVLSRDERVQLLEFTDTRESQETPAVRQLWVDVLTPGRPLGTCNADCANGLLALHYSLANSQLSILTRAVERDPQSALYYPLPAQGSHGLILRNQLNLSGGDGDTNGRYALQGLGSLGNWTGLADAQVDRSAEDRQATRYRMDQLYAERLLQGNFLRVGYFNPTVQGLTRQPRVLGNSSDTTLGVMFGSSDGLRVDSSSPSATPIYVTPNRPGVVEIYRNGQLINSQPVQPGLQSLNTRVLPGGIYDIEVRLIEDGQVTSTSEASIYKPSNWGDTEQPWRYNVYLGQSSELLSNRERERDGGLNGGVIANYLFHPRAVLGLSAQRIDELSQLGSSLDWDLLDRIKLYGNAYSTQGRGNGFDLQGIVNYGDGNLVASHSRSWLQTVTGSESLANTANANHGQQVSQSSLSLHHRVTHKSSATLRMAYNAGTAGGMAVDLGWLHRGQLWGSDADWQFSVFDRPGSLSTGQQRNRGVNLSLSMSLGGPGSRVYGSLGSRTARDGARDQNASLSYQQEVDYGALRSVGGTLTVDRYGSGLAGNTQFQNSLVRGDAYAQNSSFNNDVSAGLNLDSTVAVGGGKLAMSGEYQLYDAGLIVDVASDITDLKLRGDDEQGQGGVLRPGRNVIPVSAYKAGTLQFDFDGKEAHAAVIQPSSLSFHLNKGGVQYRQVRIMRTVTVLGRLLDAQGQPLKGALVINHASRSVSETDGFFAVEMSESTPTLEVRHAGAPLCLLTLDERNARRENDVLLVGDQVCTSASLAQAEPKSANGEA